MKQRGFTLLELIIVITIIGILAAIVLASLDMSRRSARNKAVVSQMHEYQKAIELFYSDNGYYPVLPQASENMSIRSNRYCFGDDFKNESCLDNNGFYALNKVLAINSAFSTYMSNLPRFIPGGDYAYSSPAFSGCAGTGITGQKTDTTCRESDYSIWFLLEGTNADCGGRAYRAANTEHGFTLCRLSSS